MYNSKLIKYYNLHNVSDLQKKYYDYIFEILKTQHLRM